MTLKAHSNASSFQQLSLVTFPLQPHISPLGATQHPGALRLTGICGTQCPQSEQVNRSLLKGAKEGQTSNAVSGRKTQSPACQTKRVCDGQPLLVVKHDVWLPDLLCRNSHELHPLVVRGFPFQLVVIPDLAGGGREGRREGEARERTSQIASWSSW